MVVGSSDACRRRQYCTQSIQGSNQVPVLAAGTALHAQSSTLASPLPRMPGKAVWQQMSSELNLTQNFWVSFLLLTTVRVLQAGHGPACASEHRTRSSCCWLLAAAAG